MKQAKELEIDVMWIGSFGAENSPLIQNYGEVAEGLTYPYPYNKDSKQLGITEFIKLYKTKYNSTPDMVATNAYDCLKLLTKAIESGVSSNKVKQTLLKTKNYDGASGTISFDKNGDAKKPIFIKQIKNKEFVKV